MHEWRPLEKRQMVQVLSTRMTNGAGVVNKNDKWRRCCQQEQQMVQVLSTMSTQSLEDVAKAGQGGPLQLFQLYVIKDRKFCRSLINRELPSPALLHLRFFRNIDIIGSERTRSDISCLLELIPAFSKQLRPLSFCYGLSRTGARLHHKHAPVFLASALLLQW